MNMDVDMDINMDMNMLTNKQGKGHLGNMADTRSTS
jgi:hypothetical protein